MKKNSRSHLFSVAQSGEIKYYSNGTPISAKEYEELTNLQNNSQFSNAELDKLSKQLTASPKFTVKPVDKKKLIVRLAEPGEESNN